MKTKSKGEARWRARTLSKGEKKWCNCGCLLCGGGKSVVVTVRESMKGEGEGWISGKSAS